MALFETTLILLAVAVVLLHAARHLRVPYPAMLALAGGCVAEMPWAPQVTIEPHLALALFVAPAILDTAFDLPPRELLRNWLPLTSLAVLLVLATTAAVAWAGWLFAGLPLAAAIALGAIVAPPDAAAAAAVLRQFNLPRRAVAVLQGESLLNDAVALLVFGAAVAIAPTSNGQTGAFIPSLLMAVPGGAILGILMGYLNIYAAGKVAGTLSSIIVQFVITFGTWVLAEYLHLSSIIAVVTLAMVAAHHLPARTRASDRINANAVWGSMVFVLNVLAFLLMGLQARVILSDLNNASLWSTLIFSVAVVGIVIVIRFVWVMAYGALLRSMPHFIKRHAPGVVIPSPQIGVLISWCGMRGLVTLATAMALPDKFPGRNTIVLTAFIVVLGTLVVQGLTIRPLIALLRIAPDHTFAKDINRARATMLDAAVATLSKDKGDVAQAVRSEYMAERSVVLSAATMSFQTEHNALRARALLSQRRVLQTLRASGDIDDDIYRRLEQELDWAELHAQPVDEARIIDG